MSIVPLGFPDFARRSARSDELLYDAAIGPDEPNDQTDLFSVGGANSLGINAFGTSGALRYEFDWYMDAAQTFYLGTQIVHLSDGREFTGSIPCIGPYVQVTTFGPGGVGSHSFTLWTVFSSGPHSMEVASMQLVSRDGVNVAAGGNTSETSQVVWAGYATINIATALATWRVTVQARRYDGTLFNLYRFTQVGGLTQTHQIALPMQNVVVTFFNDTAGAGLAYVYLNGANFLPSS